MSELAHPHDRLFRRTLSRRETAIDFVRSYVPAEVVACLALDSLEVTDSSFVDSELRGHLTDLVCRVGLREGGDAYVCLLIEHKSAPDRLVALQLLRYVVQVWNEHLRQGGKLPLPPVIPVVVYHGRGPWTVPTKLAELLTRPAELEPFVPRFRYVLTDLTRLADDEVRGEALLRSAFLALLHIFDRELIGAIRRVFAVLATERDRDARVDALDGLMRYFSSATDRVTEAELREAVLEAFPKGEGEEIMPTLAEQWMEQGRQQGIEQGIEQGAIATAREAVVEVLETRFEEVPEGLRGPDPGDRRPSPPARAPQGGRTNRIAGGVRGGGRGRPIEMGGSLSGPLTAPR